MLGKWRSRQFRIDAATVRGRDPKVAKESADPKIFLYPSTKI